MRSLTQRERYNLTIEDFLHHKETEYYSKRLKVKWTAEMAEDIMSFFKIDAEEELTKILENESLNQI